MLVKKRDIKKNQEGEESRKEAMTVFKVAENCIYLFLVSAGVPHGEGSEVS